MPALIKFKKTPTTLLSEAKDWLLRNLVAGRTCKCALCGQTAKVYKRHLHIALALFLIEMYRKTSSLPPEKRWVHIDRELIVAKDYCISREYSKLRFWGLLEPKEKGHDPERPGAGYWRLTIKGFAFVEGKIKVQSCAEVYNNKPIRLSGDMVSIEDALGKKFDYKELMR